MRRRTQANRYRLLTAACRRCRETLRLGHCEFCPMTEQRRQARQAGDWESASGREDAGADPQASRRLELPEP